MDDNLGKQIVKRLAALKSDRSQHESIWRDCFDFTWPIRGEGFNAENANAASAANKRAKLLDSTGTDASRILASALMSGLTPANSRWFAIMVDGASDEERQWLDLAADVIWQSIHASNFDAEAYEGCMDSVGAGWFVLFADYERDDDGQPIGLTFEQWPLHTCYLAASKRSGRIDTCYREFSMTAGQAVAEFGEDRISDTLRQAAATDQDKRVTFVHAIYPRKGKRRGNVMARELPFASCWVECASGQVVRESGFEEQPFVAPRWTRIPGSQYAVGPVFDALPDIKQLNELVGFEIAAADLAVSGMWIAEDDGVLNPRTVKVGPKKIIVANSVDSMKPLQPGSNFDVAFTQKAQLQAAIRKVLMADQLQPQDGPAMTATEVHVRVGLIRQLLGPIYGRMQAEYLQPLVERCFALTLRAGALPPMPASLADRDYAVTYQSPLARAQKLEDVSAMDRFENTLAAEAEFVPDILDRYDFDKAAAKRGELLGVPADVMRTDKQVKALRAARMAQQKREQAQASQATAAQALADEKPGVAAASLMQAQAANADALAA